MGDGNGWVRCDLGHRHWGRFGAAGLLVSNGAKVLLQQRASWTHEGGTWAVPGGARDSAETTLAAALREVAEETTLDTGRVVPMLDWVDDHGGWSYTTIVARSPVELPVAPSNAESTATQWWTLEDVRTLPLHHGFAAAWPELHRLVRQIDA